MRLFRSHLESTGTYYVKLEKDLLARGGLIMPYKYTSGETVGKREDTNENNLVSITVL